MALVKLAKKNSLPLEVTLNELVLHYDIRNQGLAHLGLFASYDSVARKVTLTDVVSLYRFFENEIPRIKNEILSESNTYRLNSGVYVYAREDIIHFFHATEGFRVYADIITDPVRLAEQKFLYDLFSGKKN